ncbi:hypothetical protein [Idiomarina sp. ST10R2A5]|uniref:hypothetical protein n=1 Tax=Idiomarina sp. ST10R2A5 TaxID=3418368 RepID=UPI003EC5BBDB
MKKKLSKLIVMLISLAVVGCSANKITTPDNYDTIYHIVEYNRGTIMVTSAFQSPKTNLTLKDLDKHLDFSKLTSFDARWANISFFLHNEQRHCQEQYTNLRLGLRKTVAKQVLPTSDISIEIYFTPKRNFLINESSKGNDTYRFFYPVSFCDKTLFPFQALEAAGKIVHETYHIMVFKSHLNSLQAEHEEEYASLLQFCNGVLSEHKAKFNKEYFNSRISNQQFNSSEIERASSEGRLKAILRIRAELENESNLTNYCAKEVKGIMDLTFSSLREDRES